MPHNFWREAPFVRLIIPLVLGIIMHRFLGGWYSSILFAIVLLFVGYLVCVFLLDTRHKFRFNAQLSIVATVFVTLLSYTSTHFYYHFNHSSYLSDQANTKILFQVTNQPTLGGIFYKTYVKALQQNGRRAQGNAVIFLEVGEQTPQYGDQLIAELKLQHIQAPKNPKEFDYQLYMQNRNIQFQGFVAFNQWRIIGNKGNPVVTYAFKIREKCKQVIEQKLNSTKHVAILHALVLGDKSGLGSELKQTFSETGTMHVLAVSGLHVGIVYLFTSSLLGFLFVKKLKTIRAVLGLLVIWSFALVSGLSPSVCRACFMFSVLSIGLELNRDSNVYNSLCFAGFVLLVVNPLNLFNVGFQFSFLAVLGIVTLQKPIRRVVKTESFVLGKIADLSAVSLSAQLATLPLGLYYFGQFPLLFLASNLLVIPAVTILVYASICLIIFHGIPIIAEVIVNVLEIYLWSVIRITETIQKFPFALLENVSVTHIELVVLFGLIGSIGSYFLRRSIKVLCTFVLLSIGLIGNQAIRRYENMQSTELIRFDIAKSKCLVLRDGNLTYLLAQHNMSNKKWVFHCKPYLRFKGVADLNMPQLRDESIVEAVSINRDSFTVNRATCWITNNPNDSIDKAQTFQSLQLP